MKNGELVKNGEVPDLNKKCEAVILIEAETCIIESQQNYLQENISYYGAFITC